MLVVFHTYLATTNQTTYEVMKSKFGCVHSPAVMRNCCFTPPQCIASCVTQALQVQARNTLKLTGKVGSCLQKLLIQLTLHCVADSSVSYLKPYYDMIPDWQPPLDPQAERMAGRKPKPRLPVVWVMIYRHLSGKGSHPRPFDQGAVKNLEQFFFRKKPCDHTAQFQPGDMTRAHADLGQV